nr:hypothetical protein [Candidatus Brachybacter algidus]
MIGYHTLVTVLVDAIMKETYKRRSNVALMAYVITARNRNLMVLALLYRHELYTGGQVRGFCFLKCLNLHMTTGAFTRWPKS